MSARVESMIIQHSVLFCSCLMCASPPAAAQTARKVPTVASWYGEEHRGHLMANGKPFNPDQLTAASWFYPLGTQVRVTAKSRVTASATNTPATVLVTITDRGPAWRLVRRGRKIDLAHAAFKELAHPKRGLVEVLIEPLTEAPSRANTTGTKPQNPSSPGPVLNSPSQ